MKSITINKNDSGQRIDKFLLKYLKGMPQSMLYKSLRKNCVKVNGKHVKKGEFILTEGDRLDLYLKDEFFVKMEFTAVSHKLDIVFEDENIIIVNKKSGVVVHADDKGTKNTLIAQIQSYLYEKGEYVPEYEHSFSPALANRLDRNTSGLVIAAKNAESLRIINEKIKNREIKKLYRAVIEGHLKQDETFSAYLTRKEKRVEVSDKMTDGAKEVCIACKTIDKAANTSVVEIELKTGRTHQIRAQLSYLGHPLAGDVKYGSKAKPGYRLCAYKLIFDFKSDAGILNYLNGREIKIDAGF